MHPVLVVYLVVAAVVFCVKLLVGFIVTLEELEKIHDLTFGEMVLGLFTGACVTVAIGGLIALSWPLVFIARIF